MRPELKDKLAGVLVPIVTPMHEDYSLKLELIPRLVDYLIEGGIRVIIPCGSTGEFPSLTDDERRQVIRTTIEAANGRVPVIGGVSDTRMGSIIELANFAKQVGADGVMITAPYYFLPDEDDIFSFFQRIDQSIDIPFLFYNNPATTKFNATLELMERISTLDNFGAIKENNSQPVRYYEELQRFGDAFPIIPAGEPPAIFNMLSGAPGFMSVAANFNPRLIVAMQEAAQAGRIQEAFEQFEKLRAYRSVFEARNRLGYPMYVVFAKAALKLIGFEVGPPRPPLRPPSEQDVLRTREVLREVMKLEVVD
ncbi:MAG: dihydrodipicolinate synthase family protein [Anaerolineales bacterium]